MKSKEERLEKYKLTKLLETNEVEFIEEYNDDKDYELMSLKDIRDELQHHLDLWSMLNSCFEDLIVDVTIERLSEDNLTRFLEINIKLDDTIIANITCTINVINPFIIYMKKEELDVLIKELKPMLQIQFMKLGRKALDKDKSILYDL